MADFSVFDNNSQMFLEITLVSWLENANQFNLSIRPRGQKGIQSKAVAQAIVPLYLMNDLIANLSNPNTSGVISTNDNLYGSGNVGRFNNEFTITNNSGSGRVSFNDAQWKILVDYFTHMSSKAQEIKAIGRNIRMHMINLFRELGIDQPNANGYFKTTQNYDYRYDSAKNYPGNTNNGNSNYRSNNNLQRNSNSIDDATYRSTPQGMPNSGMRGNSNANPALLGNMPSQNFTQQNTQRTQQLGNPSSDNNVNSGPSIPLGSPMPPLPNIGSSALNLNGSMGEYTGSIQDMLNSTFNNN